jgi:integrase/recombinase XerD
VKAQQIGVSTTASTFAPERAKAAPARASSDDEDVIQMWLHGRSPQTQRVYRMDVGRFMTFAQAPLPKVVLADLQRFSDSLASLAPITRFRILSAVRSLIAFAHRLGYLRVDIGRALRLPARRDELAARILPEDLVQKLMRVDDCERDRALLRLLYGLGVRATEAATLRWKDLQNRGDQAGQATIFGKGGKTRVVFVPPALWAELVALRAGTVSDGGPVFMSKRGSPLSYSQILRIVRRAADRAGIEKKVSPHWLRHAHASHALDRGAPIHLVQATLGHASVATTGRYLHAKPSDSSARFLTLGTPLP